MTKNEVKRTLNNTDEWNNMLVPTEENVFVIYDSDDLNSANAIIDDNCDECEFGVANILPAIDDVREIENGGTNVVIVYFADDTTEKAVLSPEDTYSLEQGISICLEKKLLSMIVPEQGSSIYNKLIKYAIKIYNHNRVDEELARIEAETAEIKAQKEAEKIKAKKERRRKLAEEREIRIRKEAYKQAFTELMQKNMVMTQPYPDEPISNVDGEIRSDWAQ